MNKPLITAMDLLQILAICIVIVTIMVISIRPVCGFMVRHSPHTKHLFMEGSR